MKQKGRSGIKATEIFPKLVIRIPTADEEFEYLWFVLNKLSFYREMGYSVEIPEEKKFQRLANNTEDVKSADEKLLRRLFTEKVYNRNYYMPGLDELKKHQQTIETAFPIFKELHGQWGFKVFSKYYIYLTAYGPGGNYNYEKGIVRLFTKLDGSFKRKHPAHTPLHEMVHMGIEAIIVSKFALTHAEKERVVDLICTLKLGSIIPGYKMQSLGEVALDDYVNNETIDSLPKAIEKFVADHAR